MVLPMDVLRVVLSFVDAPAVARCGTTCKALHAVCGDKQVWLQLLASDYLQCMQSNPSAMHAAVRAARSDPVAAYRARVTTVARAAQELADLESIGELNARTQRSRRRVTVCIDFMNQFVVVGSWPAMLGGQILLVSARADGNEFLRSMSFAFTLMPSYLMLFCLAVALALLGVAYAASHGRRTYTPLQQAKRTWVLAWERSSEPITRHIVTWVVAPAARRRMWQLHHRVQHTAYFVAARVGVIVLCFLFTAAWLALLTLKLDATCPSSGCGTAPAAASEADHLPSWTGVMALCSAAVLTLAMAPTLSPRGMHGTWAVGGWRRHLPRRIPLSALALIYALPLALAALFIGVWLDDPDPTAQLRTALTPLWVFHSLVLLGVLVVGRSYVRASAWGRSKRRVTVAIAFVMWALLMMSDVDLAQRIDGVSDDIEGTEGVLTWSGTHLSKVLVCLNTLIFVSFKACSRHWRFRRDARWQNWLAPAPPVPTRAQTVDGDALRAADRVGLQHIPFFGDDDDEFDEHWNEHDEDTDSIISFQLQRRIDVHDDLDLRATRFARQLS